MSLAASDQTTYKTFTINYLDELEYHHLKREIFVNHVYELPSSAETPNIIDLGAHIGLATLYWKYYHPEATIVAVEPHPELFPLLEHNIWQNQLENVTPIRAAVIPTDLEAETIRLHLPGTGEWPANASLLERGWTGSVTMRHSSVVTTTTLPKLIDQHFPPDQKIDLVKIDVEGVEGKLLQTLPAAGWERIHQFILEFHPGGRHTLEDILQVFERHDFSTQVEPGFGELKTVIATKDG